MVKTAVLAASGPYRRELLTFLRSIPDLELIAVVDNPVALLEVAANLCPALAILDANPETLAGLQHCRPEAASLVLAENLEQIRQATAAGAGQVLLRGFSAEEFLHAVQNLF